MPIGGGEKGRRGGPGRRGVWGSMENGKPLGGWIVSAVISREVTWGRPSRKGKAGES